MVNSAEVEQIVPWLRVRVNKHDCSLVITGALKHNEVRLTYVYLKRFGHFITQTPKKPTTWVVVWGEPVVVWSVVPAVVVCPVVVRLVVVL